MALPAAVCRSKWTEPGGFHWSPWSVALLGAGLMTEPVLDSSHAGRGVVQCQLGHFYVSCLYYGSLLFPVHSSILYLSS